MSWHKITLTVKSIPAKELTTLRKKFYEIWTASGSPKGIALFCDMEPQPQTYRRVPTQLSFYFTPGSLRCVSSIVSDQTVATRCDPPFARNVVFLAGDQDCEDLLRNGS
jgi:hypothetical protein